MIMLVDGMISRHERKCKPLCFDQCGIEFCVPGHSNGPRSRFYSVIHFVLEGSGKMIINDKKYEIDAGQVFVIPAHLNASYVADEKNPWKYCWIGYMGTEADSIISQIFEKDVYIKPVTNGENIWMFVKTQVFGFVNMEYTENILGPDIHVYKSETLAQSLWQQGFLYQMLSLIAKGIENPEEKPGKEINYVESIKKYIDNYCMDIQSVNQLADIFHLHPNYLSSIFSKKYHISPKQYLTERKIDFANHLLEKTDTPIQNIAISCGFSNPSVFGKTYKKHVQISPSEYRKKIREYYEAMENVKR